MKRSLMSCSLIASFSIMGQAYAVDCSQLASWEQNTAYNGGAKIQNSTIAYQANWWSQGNNPATHSGPGQEWTNIGNCGGNPGNQPP